MLPARALRRSHQENCGPRKFRDRGTPYADDRACAFARHELCDNAGNAPHPRAKSTGSRTAMETTFAALPSRAGGVPFRGRAAAPGASPAKPASASDPSASQTTRALVAPQLPFLQPRPEREVVYGALPGFSTAAATRGANGQAWRAVRARGRSGPYR